MKLHRARGLTAAGLLAAAAGCTVHHGDFTVLSDKLVRLDHFDLATADRSRGVVGEHVAHVVLAFPTATPSLERAIRGALDQGGGDLMSDAVVTLTWWYVPLLYGRVEWRVEGDVVRTRGRP